MISAIARDLLPVLRAFSTASIVIWRCAHIRCTRRIGRPGRTGIIGLLVDFG